MKHALITGVLAAATVTAAQGTTDPTATVVRGFANAVYEVRPTPQPGRNALPADVCGATYTRAGPTETAAPFARGLLILTSADRTGVRPAPRSPGDLCTAMSVAAGPAGLTVEFALRTNRDLTADFKFDGFDPALRPNTNDYVEITICPGPCGNSPVLIYRITSNENVFVRADGEYAPWRAATYAALPTPTPAPAASGSPASPALPAFLWTAALKVPWSALPLPIVNSATTTTPLSVALCVHLAGERGPCSSPSRKAAIAVALRDAFAPSGNPLVWGPSDHLQYRDSDHRTASIAQYFVYTTPALAPPLTQRVFFVDATGSGNALFILPTPTPSPAKSSTKLAAPWVEVNAPLGQRFAFAGTLAQAGPLQSIVNVVADALPSPLPMVCSSCTNFQNAAAPWFTFPTTSSRLTSLPATAGGDDDPLTFKSLPSLLGGGALAYSDGTSQVAVAHTQADTPDLVATTNTVIAYEFKQRSTRIDALASYVKRPATPAPAPGATAIPGVIALPHLSTYAFSVGHDIFFGPFPGGITRVSPYARLLHDATNNKSVYLGGIELAEQSATTDGLFSTMLVGGYRSAERGYVGLSGSPITSPTVAGPFVGADISFTKTGADVPAFDLSLGGNAYFSPGERTRSGSARLTVNEQVGAVALGAFYSVSGTFQTGSLAAVSGLGAQLGDDPYQAVVNLMDPALRRAALEAHDYTVGLSITPKKLSGHLGDVQTKFTLGYDFDSLAPFCETGTITSPFLPGSTPTTTTTVVCGPGQRQRFLIGTAAITVGQVTLAGSIKPTYEVGGRVTSPSNRLYKALLAWQIDKCSSLIVTTTNDRGVLSSATLSQLSSGFQAELTSELPSGFLGMVHAPTAVVGMTNTFGFAETPYTGGLTAAGPQFQLSLPYSTHTRTFYTGLRLGNPAFRRALGVDDACLPPRQPNPAFKGD